MFMHREAFLLLSLLWVLLLLATVEGQSSTTAPQTTPGPLEGMPIKLSFVIDGVAYVATCTFAGPDATNCTFAMDHGLNVTRILATGASTSDTPPVYFQAIVYITLALVLVLGILAIAAYCYWKKTAGAGYGAVPQQPYVPPEGYGQPPQAYPEPPGPRGYYGEAAQLAGHRGRVIQVGLVRPSACVPGMATLTMTGP